MWFKVLSEPLTNPLMVHRDKLRIAWITLRNKMQDACVGVPGEHWTRILFPLAHGIMGQVIMIPIANRWKPVSFECWESSDRERLVLNIESIKGISPFINSVISPIHLVDLAVASTHCSSTGMQNGIDWR